MSINFATISTDFSSMCHRVYDALSSGMHRFLNSFSCIRNIESSVPSSTAGTQKNKSSDYTKMATAIVSPASLASRESISSAYRHNISTICNQLRDVIHKEMEGALSKNAPKMTDGLFRGSGDSATLNKITNQINKKKLSSSTISKADPISLSAVLKNELKKLLVATKITLPNDTTEINSTNFRQRIEEIVSTEHQKTLTEIMDTLAYAFAQAEDGTKTAFNKITIATLIAATIFEENKNISIDDFKNLRPKLEKQRDLAYAILNEWDRQA